MVIDPSAILAIIYAEAEEKTFLELIGSNETCLLSSPGYVELSIFQQLTLQKTITMSAFTLTKKLHSLSLGLSPLGAIALVKSARNAIALSPPS